LKKPTDDALALLETHGKQLFALLFRLTLRNDVAEDLLQDLFCKLAASDSFRRAENRLAYAHRMATNLAFDWRRRRKFTGHSNEECADKASPLEPPLAGLVRREELEQTLNAISELPHAASEIIVLRYLEDCSYDEIARQFGKTTHQVRALASKALRQLRATLREREVAPPLRLKTHAVHPEP
jgi:RNA polymerase sigma-70 factor (ECF subfamily)